MARVLAIGIATLDIINQVAHYPAEDEEMRVLAQSQRRGGNATNTLVVLSQLGHRCDWAGILIDEADADIIKQDLSAFNVGFHLCKRLTQGKMPTSYITLNQANGSRTIVHYRQCPELDFEHFRQLPLNEYDWIHFEGRHIPQLRLMLDFLQQQYPHIRRSLEVEKPRDGIEALFDKVDLLLFSQPYATARGFHSASDFLQQLDSPALASCTWGKAGAWLKQQQHLLHCPAFPPTNIVDTLGAGDTFNAGLISALLQQHPAQEALRMACQLAGKKCGQYGFAKLGV